MLVQQLNASLGFSDGHIHASDVDILYSNDTGLKNISVIPVQNTATITE